MDNLGPVPIPDPIVVGAFPLTPSYASGLDYEPPIAIHSFDQPGLKTEQRFVLGSGARRFRVRKTHLSCAEYDALKAHWMAAQGMYAQFPFTYRLPTGTESYTARYENPALTFDHMIGMVTGDPGVTLLEVPSATPSYTPVATITRFPDATFAAALTQQVQHLIPLIAILPRGAGASTMYLSNQRVTVGGALYLPRLLTWQGISQSSGEASDSARFTFGNADGVFLELANSVDLHRAPIQFALFHVESLYLVKMWAGYALSWSFDASGQFHLNASDGAFELGLGYPVRTNTRTCWKVYKGRFCPSTSPLATCPKSWEACNERGVPRSFGGVIVPAQEVRVKDNSTGVWGFGRSRMTSVTVAADTIYQRPVQEIYTDTPMVVNCDVAGGRDESDFYSAIGIVGEGPIGGYSRDLIRHRLDGQPPHDPLRGGGRRGVLGNDPAAPEDYFGLSRAPWDAIPPGITYAAGLAFAEIRRSDEKGLQLSKVADREMTVTVTGGIGGWTWTAAGARAWTPALSNVVWVAVNVYLRALGLRVTPDTASLVSAAQMEAFFDVDQAIAMAAICELPVAKLVPAGTTDTERQFPFRGALKERKPLKDWLQEILNCCLGFYTFVNGKLWIGIRQNSSVLAGNAFTRAHILFGSLQVAPIEPRFNWLVGEFGDEEFDSQLNNLTVYDIDHAGFVGTPESPQYLTSTMSLVGVSNKSQAARIIATRLREELGGVGPVEQRNARALRFRTTVLGLRTMVGDVISLDHAWLPGGHAEGRVTRWTLNPDFSIDIEAAPSADSMYDLTAGPKPDDVPAEPVPPELLPAPAGLAWMPNEIGPFPGDPLYPDMRERTFDLWQDYHITREGIWDPALWVRGEFPVNLFEGVAQPRITGAALVAGGTLDGPGTIYLAVTLRDADGQPAPPSNLTATWIASGLNDRRVQLTLAPAPPGSWAGFDVWAGTDRRRIGWQSGANTALPSVINFDGPVAEMTQGMPTPAARKIRLAAKHVWHSGVAGVLITGVPANNQLQVNDFIGSTDAWTNRILSALADESDGSAPLWNFRVTAFDQATGTFTVTPDAVRAAAEDSVQVGDVLIVRSIATSATSTEVTDTLWRNSVALVQFGADGMNPDEEIGRIARILRGKGAGQFRYITANDRDTLTVWPPWETIPDTSSILIVEAADYVYFAESSELEAPAPGTKVEIRIRVDNLRDRVALIGGFLVDDQGRFTDEQFAVFREIYVFGQPPTVRAIGPGAGPWDALPTDHTLRADTSENDVAVQLPALYVYQGRTLQVFNDGPSGAHNVIVQAAPGETLSDGSTTATAEPGQMLKITAG